uniref:Reverse transcriptase domain-containing protein n=1 Tax=Amphimedon queenslandica TaxID=400682 RepID=A0A1X7UDB0_AMPQE
MMVLFVVVTCKEAHLQVFSVIDQVGPSLGVHLSREKSLMYVPSDEDVSTNVLPPEIPVTQDGFILGAPVGSDSFCQSFALKQVSKVKSSIWLLSKLEDCHIEFAVLRSCLLLPKLMFLLHSCPTSVIDDAIVACDVVLRSAVSELVSTHMCVWSWLKATLPVTLGGLGIHLAPSHAPAALIASVSQSALLVTQLLGQDPPPLPFLGFAVSFFFHCWSV